MIRSIFILGNHIQALGIARMAHKIGLRTELFSDYRASITRFSRTCNTFHLFKNETDLAQILSGKGQVKDTLLIPTNDRLLGFLMKNYDVLRQSYHMSFPEPAITDICFNKRKTYQFAGELGIQLPESHFPDNEEQLMKLSEKINYPVILKPAIMYKFYDITGKKVYLCDSAEELIKNYLLFVSVIPADEVIVQEFLMGGAENLYSFGSFSADGQVLGSFMANRIRQKPMDFGVSTCFAKTVNIDQLRELSHLILSKLKYFGPSEIEFMYDQNENEFKLIEINPRFWKWHSLANALGINLVELMVKYLDGNQIQAVTSTRENVAWIERLTDTYVVLGELLAGNMSIGEYLATLKMQKESACWSWKDPMPGIMYLLLSPYLWFKR